MDTEAVIVKDTQTLHSDMQTLVYENYNKFISATDTIRKMKTDFKKMETEMNLLVSKMTTITDFSGEITGTLQGTRQHLCKLAEKHSLLQKLQFLSSLPTTLKSLTDEGNYKKAVNDYIQAQKVLDQYGSHLSFQVKIFSTKHKIFDFHHKHFQGIQKDCMNIMDEVKEKLKSDFQMSGLTAKSLAETGDLLLLLDEKPSDLAKILLQSASRRLHEQIVMLQVNSFVPKKFHSLSHSMNKLGSNRTGYDRIRRHEYNGLSERFNFGHQFIFGNVFRQICCGQRNVIKIFVI